MRHKRRWIFLGLIVIVVIVVLVARREPYIAPGSFLVVPIGGTYLDAQPSDVIGQLLRSQEKVLSDVLLELEKVRVDARFKGVLVKVTPLDVDFAKLQELRGALQRVKATGKRVIAWLSGEADTGNREYYLASVADRVYFSENTLLPLLGLKATYLFLGQVWENLHVDMRVEQIGVYKSFGDFLSRKEMSTAHREMADSLLDSLNQQFLTDIAAARSITVAQLSALVDSAILTPEDYRRAGLIDGIRYFEDLLTELAEPPEETLKIVTLTTYQRVKATSVGLMKGPRLAIVYGVGGVATGKSGWNALGESMGADTIIGALQDAAGDDTIRAVVFRIDSPGGSALASDMIWHGVKMAAQKKPVIVSMSGAAASGGYYMAVAADKIVAQPGTLTGSIGIVFSLPNVRGLFDHLGLRSETLTRGQYAGLFDTLQSWRPEERQQVQRAIETLYQTFTRKVADGRGLSVQEVDRIGRGRVWTGAQAKQLGLVDALGGLDTALQLAKEAAGIPAPTNVRLVFYPKAKGLLESLLQRVQGETRVNLKLPAELERLVPSLLASIVNGPAPALVMSVAVHVR